MTISKLLHEMAFSYENRMPNSDAYKAGTMAALTYCDGGKKSPIDNNPHAPGTAEHDAWWAGVREGYQIWDQYTQSLQDGAA